MAKAEPYAPPDDPDFKALSDAGYRAYLRDRPRVISWDTETTGVAHFDLPFCVTIAWRRPVPKMLTIGTGPGPKNVLAQVGDRQVVLTYGDFKWLRDNPGTEQHYFELAKHDSAARVGYMLRQSAVWIGHNLKFDATKAIVQGLITYTDFEAAEIHDTEALAHLDNEHRDKGLKDLMVSVLQWDDTLDVEVKSGKNKGAIKRVPREKAELDFVRRKLKLKKDDGWHLLPRSVVVPYAIKDAEATLLLYEHLRPLVERHADLWQLYLEEMEGTRVLLDMEHAGLGVREQYVSEQIKLYNRKVLEHRAKMSGIVGKPIGKEEGEFNPNSNPQLREFFVAAGYDLPSYDKNALPAIPHPFAAALLAYRKDERILTGYFKPIRDEQRDGILHPSFRQHGTVTGRMSSGSEKG